jgi:RecB family endonuclease NucS
MEREDGAWSMQQAARYENEQALHDMVMRTPELLPLSGSPRLTVIGREVGLPTSGYADVIAFEPDGRPVIIEVKLRNNAESRRAVVAQTLSYAASLHRLSREDLEETILSKHLGGQSLYDRVRESTQDEDMTQSDFEASIDAHLAPGPSARWWSSTRPRQS